MIIRVVLVFGGEASVCSCFHQLMAMLAHCSLTMGLIPLHHCPPLMWKNWSWHFTIWPVLLLINWQFDHLFIGLYMSHGSWNFTGWVRPVWSYSSGRDHSWKLHRNLLSVYEKYMNITLRSLTHSNIERYVTFKIKSTLVIYNITDVIYHIWFHTCMVNYSTVCLLVLWLLKFG